jgi:hypothetical protein
VEADIEVYDDDKNIYSCKHPIVRLQCSILRGILQFTVLRQPVA